MKKIFVSLIMSAAAMSAAAQNIDPTVEVSREYEGKLMEVHKPSIEMAVPDTLYRFDYDFDYSVFENPYKGTYDFNPYILEMKPAPSDNGSGVFYLMAGAGYTLHPTLDLLWSPQIKGPFNLDVYGMHRSYIGEYRASGGFQQWKGYDLLSEAGADAEYDWKKASLGFGASYQGIADKNPLRKRAYNAVDAYLDLKSKSSWPEHFMYEVSSSYSFAEDNSDYAYDPYIGEHLLKVGVCLGPDFGKSGKVLIDVDASLVSYMGAVEGAAGLIRVVPSYRYSRGILKLDAGIGVNYIAQSGVLSMTRGQFVYPDIDLELAIIPDAMRLYLLVGGGERLNTYSSLLQDNRHLDLRYGLGSYASLLNVTVERLSAELGFRGRISSFFTYRLRGGYANYKSAALDAVINAGGILLPAMGYAPYSKLYAALDWDLNLQSIRFDGTLGYTYAYDILVPDLIAPASLSGDLSVMYNWNRRIQAGIDCNFSTSRSSLSGYTVPSYADLGIYGEYELNRKLSFWLRGGNLLNMEIQRNLFFAEKGVNFTAGICLNL